MGHNIKYQMGRSLQLQLKLGQSKRAAKAKNGGKANGIYSTDTMATYCRQVAAYGDWLADNGLNKCSLQDAASHAAEYLAQMQNKAKTGPASAWTYGVARSAIAKACGVSADQIAPARTRAAKDIKRGRSTTARAAKAAARAPADVAICKAVGPRHAKEAHQITADRCIYDDAGNVISVRIKGKGGLWRSAPVVPGSDGQAILTARAHAAAAAGRGSVPLVARMDHANLHGYRADYAAAMYRQGVAMGLADGRMYNPRGIPATGIYAGGLDKCVLDFVSKALGHGSDRYYTVWTNYLSYGR